MKISRFLALFSMLCLFALPAAARAEVTYLKITVKKAMVWPIRDSGKCFDPCLGKKFKLPARDKSPEDFMKYMENDEFRKACTSPKYGGWTPDPLVEIKIGKYGKFTTDKKNNTCLPEWNVSHIFRVAPGDKFSVGVYDNDGAGGVQAKRDLMGIYEAAQVPAELMNGGTLVIKRFGQVEGLILSAEKVSAPAPAESACSGVFRARIVEVDVESTKADGKTWDRGWGKAKLPDVVVEMSVGSDKIATPKAGNTTSAKFDKTQLDVPVKKGMAVRILVKDIDPFNKFEVIGQTAFGDVCELLSKSQDGIYTFPPFGRVKKVVVIFRKIR
ncbi:MAG: hypothetical protein H6727_03470 [Myxococcales bacterium]|nr:hypothetical protein [Myxococcales bacterium]